MDADLAWALVDAAFVEAITGMRARLGRSVLVGLCGSQGSGKSTTAARLASRLEQQGHAVAVCSLDDFYLTRDERARLGQHVHPLLATRGVPGTHDVALMDRTVSALLGATAHGATPVPLFDKAADDRRPEAEWRIFSGRVDVALLEGWCVGARPQDEMALRTPINALEREEDADGRWRRHVNRHLADDYAAFFARLDLRLMLRAPSFDSVHGWRAEQERGLERSAASARSEMNAAQIARFIAHYERLTRWQLEDEPADLIADLNSARRPARLRWKAYSPGSDDVH